MKKVTHFLMNNTSIPILIIFVLLATILTVNSPVDYIFPVNLFNVFNQNSIKGIMAIGMTILILTGYFDMSLCTLVSFSAALTCMLQSSIGVIPAVIIAILVGFLVGVINGTFVAYLGYSAFVVTLAMMLVCRGLTYIVPNEQSIQATSEAFLAFGNLKIGPLTVMSWLFIIGLFVAHYVLKYTTHGRNTYAVGGNATAAENAGINVKRTIWINFVICGTLSGVGGVLYASRLGASTPAIGWPDMHMLVIAAVVLGGTKLSGGFGNIWYSLIGVFVLGSVTNLMDLMNADPWISTFCTGAIMIAVLLIDKFMSDQRAKANQTV